MAQLGEGRRHLGVALEGHGYAEHRKRQAAALESLGFSVDVTEDSLLVRAPRDRIDVREACDVAEEVLRGVGIDRVAAELPPPAPAVAEPEIYGRRRSALGAFMALSYRVAVSYSLVDPGLLARIGQPAEVTIANALSGDLAALRTTLRLGLLQAVARNLARGVGEIALASPPGPQGAGSPFVLLAADITGIREVYRVGGAQAIAALAFGTEEIPAVDKIAGPGNRYVAAAKQAVYGTVDVDLIAGPSELLVVADAQADPRLIAADLLAQAEHDPDAEVALLALGPKLVPAVVRELEAALPASGPARESLAHASALVEPDVAKAIEAADAWAAEHLELHVADWGPWIRGVRAGSVFVGARTPTALGDYAAGPTHILPTGRSARFLSGLSKLHFLRTFSVTQVEEVDPELFGLAETLAGDGRSASSEPAPEIGLILHEAVEQAMDIGGDMGNAQLAGPSGVLRIVAQPAHGS